MEYESLANNNGPDNIKCVTILRLHMKHEITIVDSAYYNYIGGYLFSLNAWNKGLKY